MIWMWSQILEEKKRTPVGTYVTGALGGGKKDGKPTHQIITVVISGQQEYRQLKFFPLGFLSLPRFPQWTQLLLSCNKKKIPWRNGVSTKERMPLTKEIRRRKWSYTGCKWSLLPARQQLGTLLGGIQVYFMLGGGGEEGEDEGVKVAVRV